MFSSLRLSTFVVAPVAWLRTLLSSPEGIIPPGIVIGTHASFHFIFPSDRVGCFTVGDPACFGAARGEFSCRGVVDYGG